MSNLDDPLALVGDLPPTEMWGEDMPPDVDVELLAEAFFDSNNNNNAIGTEGFGIGDLQKEAAFLNGLNGSATPTPLGEIGPTPDFLQEEPLPTDISQQQQQPQQPQTPIPQQQQTQQTQQPQQQQPQQFSAVNQMQPPAPVAPQPPAGLSQVPPNQFVTMSPAMSAMATADPNSTVNAAAAAAMMAAAAAAAGNSNNPQQQAFIMTTNPETGEAQAVANPFLIAAAAGMPVDRAAFVQAAFATRAKSRRSNNNNMISSEEAERRRERNRLLAKKTRDRKKNYMGTLQDEVMELQRANAELKAMVKMNMDEKDSTKLLEGCDAIDKVPETVWEACGTDKKQLAAEDFDLVTSIQKAQTAFVITDPSFEDNPIVFVSPAFLELTGYKREQVIGRNCRFLQGTDTSSDKVEQIRAALRDGEDVGVTLVNYKADGTPFWNRLFIAAVRDVNDQIVNYMGVAVQVARPEPGDPEHDKVLS